MVCLHLVEPVLISIMVEKVWKCCQTRPYLNIDNNIKNKHPSNLYNTCISLYLCVCFFPFNNTQWNKLAMTFIWVPHDSTTLKLVSWTVWELILIQPWIEARAMTLAPEEFDENFHHFKDEMDWVLCKIIRAEPWVSFWPFKLEWSLRSLN